MKGNLALIIVALMLTISCNDNSYEPINTNLIEIENQGLIPLKVGNYWKYKTDMLKEDGSFSYEEWAYETRITNSSMNPKEQNDKPRYHRSYSSKIGLDEHEWLFRNQPDGLYQMGGKTKGDSIFTELLLLKYPIKIGEKWNSEILSYDIYLKEYLIGDTITFTCTDTAATFQTPIGTFKCFVYHRRQSQGSDVWAQLDIYEYYSPKVGLVGIITNSYFPSNIYPPKVYPKRRTYLYETNVEY